MNHFFIAIATLIVHLESSSAFVLLHKDADVYSKDKIVVDINIDNCPMLIADFKELVEFAINKWDVSGASMSLKIGDEVSHTVAEMASSPKLNDQRITAICTDDVSIHFPNQAKSEVTYAGVGGVVLTSKTFASGYLVFNFDPETEVGALQSLTANQASDSYAPLNDGFKYLATHELGHALGLGHSGDSDSVMNYSGQLPLAQDDIDAIRYLYPSKAALGCATLTHPSTNSASALLIILFAPMALACYLLIRKKRFHIIS